MRWALDSGSLYSVSGRPAPTPKTRARAKRKSDGGGLLIQLGEGFAEGPPHPHSMVRRVAYYRALARAS
jgi:hypothetical protein